MKEIIVLSDEEFYAMKEKERRIEFLKELEQLSKPVKSKKQHSFSIKDVNPEEDKPKKEIEHIPVTTPLTGVTPSEDWGEFVSDLSEFNISPIESVTDNTITGFQLDPDAVDGPENHKYGKVFKKELAMLSEVLKDVKTHGVRVDSALKKMSIGGKGSSSRVTGVPKGYSDLIEAYNSINVTKVNVIKEMANLRSKQMDWELKDKANSPSESESVDNIADLYYKRIIGGGTKNFIDNNSNVYKPAKFEYDTINDSQTSDMYFESNNTDASNIDALSIGTGFNITQPLSGIKNDQVPDISGDDYGYIANEKNDYELVAYQYDGDKYQLGALDRYGEPLDNVELPSDHNPDIVETLKLRPGSNFVYDKYGRSYRVIEMGSVDISDVDDMDYPF